MKHYDGDPQAIMNNMVMHGRNLALKSNEYSELCADFAAKERDYNVALVSEMLRLKTQESIPATACERLAKGTKAIADLRYARDVAKGMMTACDKAMQNLRTVLNAYQSILAWERKLNEL